MEIRTKAEFFQLWHAGVLGNRTRIARSSAKAWSWNIQDYGFRCAPRGGGGGPWAGVKRDQFWETVRQWDADFGVENYIIDDRVPDEHQTIQGEVCRTFRGLEGFIGSSHLPMRLAMAQNLLRPRSPVETFVLLNSYMDPSSRDDVDSIFELFPDATIEFTCFDCAVGILRRNTMFWEIRNY